ncbi:hypothetical protein STRDD11_02591 [Streptococcus sp. DD11]|uniref:hypothetical protein n=1 Tax=Streptococcus sp. DD11 TaxID=1777879 RepID=UPI00079A3CF7|nr:hypothetical protein [Streptococcus sp. DD11]KXT77531.1 hypothetical protein STRDD11_02591 [Streptococcus sp. DD11]
MTYMYSDKELNGLNRYPNVYSVDPDYAHRHGYKIVTPNPQNDGDTNIIKAGGKEFQVVATKNDEETGFQGLAVAPIVNGQPDYQSVAVVAAGTDPESKINPVGSLSRDTASAIEARQNFISPQYEAADQFVKEVMDDPRYEVRQLTGYSQGAYMLKAGAKYHIPVTTFNAWFKYGALTEEEKQFIKKNPAMFIDYRRKNDDVVRFNDLNNPEWYNSRTKLSDSGLGVIYWVDGTSHDINAWKFDPASGQVINGKGSKPLISDVFKAYDKTLKGMSHFRALKTKWASNRISGTEQIYLDAAQGQILSSSMASVAQIGADEVTALTQEANEEIEALWSKIDFSSYTELSAEEVEGIFASQGVTREQYVDGFKAEIAHAAAQMTDSAAAFARLDHQLQAAIEKVLATDAQLAGEFQQWKAKM